MFQQGQYGFRRAFRIKSNQCNNCLVAKLKYPQIKDFFIYKNEEDKSIGHSISNPPLGNVFS